MAAPEVAPQIVHRPRPKLLHWMVDHDLDVRAMADLLGCSHGQVSIITKPFGDPERRAPRLPLLERIVEITGGEVTGEDFLEPHVRKGPVGGHPMVLAGGRAE